MTHERIHRFDNLKGLAILMIVCWHLNTSEMFPMLGDKILYITALPLFFFVSGYFSKTSSDQYAKSFKRLLIPYIIFTIVLKLFRFMLTGKIDISMIFIQASVGLWFLVALFFMKVMLPLFDKFRYPLLTAFICAVFFGIIDIHPNILGLTRLFAYFPIFLLGFYYNSYKEKLTEIQPKLINYYEKHFKIIFVLGLVLILIAIDLLDVRVMVFKTPYAGNILFEMIKRVAVILIEMAMVLLLNRAMTNKESILTKFGRNSMAIYMLHMFILIYFMDMNVKLYVANDIITLIANLAFVFVVTLILSADIITKFLNRITDFVADLILKPIDY